MNLDEQLRTAYQEETKNWTISDRTKHKILNAVRRESRLKRHRKKWLVTVVLAAVLIIPTGAYAGYFYLANEMYGSQENISAVGGTSEDYMRLEAKLQTAKKHLSEEEFIQFMDLMKQMGQMALKYADQQGEMHPEQWSVTEQREFNRLTAELEPFFEKLEAASVDSPKEPMDQEQFWKEQLAMAETKFSEEQFTEFKSLYEQMKQYESLVSDQDGNIHEERLSAEQKEELKQVRGRIFPFLEKLGLDVRKPGE
ncbi:MULTISPECIES: DUF3600 domain-containing protein [Paenibacillus]|uniref:Uncharacterized protein DUF3600 n=1 Tax=Paenibacillus pabuli TaxID=1472 RepID=A0A855XNJ7_9BACL|nr:MULTISPECIES: DUF3600 domain-containing protein [Paenibacillus]PWW32915.1 uncharacterized protein DUF3600 [Paenibacillus pabuli]PXV98798.1 uncharacterized protein DUF3600 [Paenibacillus taichungensis]RAI96940.1 uncharacterized protein DUF3600 [Paenibacillus pabuli]